MFETYEEYFPIAFGFFAGQVDGALARQIRVRQLELIERAEAEGQNFYFFINALHVECVTPAARKLLAEGEAELTAERAERVAARVVMQDSLAVRGAISAMSWFSPRLRDLVSVKSFDAGVSRLGQVMRERGCELDTDAVEALRRLNARAEARYASA